jgi:CheY-like chemotaxis protein
MDSKKTFRIMLADDDQDDRDLFAEAVSDADADVDSVPNGVQLMKVLSERTELPDFIFLDLNMPEKNGKECLQEIRENDHLKDIPVIIYSTSSRKKDIDDTYELGANLYLTKPNSYTELKKNLKSILEIDWSQYEPGSRRETFVFSA